jgi:hypothetical protein
VAAFVSVSFRIFRGILCLMRLVGERAQTKRNGPKERRGSRWTCLYSPSRYCSMRRWWFGADRGGRSTNVRVRSTGL